MIAALVPSSTRPLTIIELCLSTGRGGLEGYAAGLVRDLSARGHQIRVVARPDSEFAARAQHTPALTLTGNRYRPLHGARRLARLARDADIIHLHRSADLPLAAAAKRLAGGRPALVYSRHMAITRDRRSSPIHRLMFDQVDLMLTLTEQVAEAARVKLPLPASRIAALPPGIDAGDARMDCAELRPPCVDFVVGCFSRIEPAKGQHELVEALIALDREGLALGAVIAGPVMNADYAERLRARVRESGLEKRIRFPGALADARPAMSCCDVVAMPSLNETLGLVIVEAMLRGVPVVATAAGGVLEVITDGETGLTYPVGDTAALADNLARLARDEEFRFGLARAGRSFAHGHYDRDTHLVRLESFFHELRSSGEN